MTTHRIPICELPNSFFHSANSGQQIDGFFQFAGDLSVVSGIKIKVNSSTRLYKGIQIKFDGRITGRFDIHIHDDNVSVEVGHDVSGGFLFKCWKDVSLSIGSKTTANSLEMWLEDGAKIRIGADCLIAHEVVVLAGDMHGIFDTESLQQLNEMKASVEVGDHVWLGRRVTLTKTARIEAGCIIGAGAVVSGKIPEACAAGGTPAKVLRNGVSWTRSRICRSDEIQSAISHLQHSR